MSILFLILSVFCFSLINAQIYKYQWIDIHEITPFALTNELFHNLSHMNTTLILNQGGEVFCPPSYPFCYQITLFSDQQSNYTLYERNFSTVNLSESCTKKLLHNGGDSKIVIFKLDIPINISLSEEDHLKKNTWVNYKFYRLKKNPEDFKDIVRCIADVPKCNQTPYEKIDDYYCKEINVETLEYEFLEYIEEDKFLNIGEGKLYYDEEKNRKYIKKGDKYYLIIGFIETYSTKLVPIDIKKECGEKENVTINYPLYITNDAKNLWDEVMDELGYDAFNPTSEFYKIFCIQYTHYQIPRGYDVTPEARRNQLYKGDFRFCPTDCEYQGMNRDMWAAICNCPFREFNITNITWVYFDFFKAIEYDKKHFGENLDTFHTFKAAECNNIIFSKEGFVKNYLGFSVLIIAFVMIISFIMFFYTRKGRVLNVVEVIYNSSVSIECPLKRNKLCYYLNDDNLEDNDNDIETKENNYKNNKKRNRRNNKKNKRKNKNSSQFLEEMKENEKAKLINVSLTEKYSNHNSINLSNNSNVNLNISSLPSNFNPPKKGTTRVIEKHITIKANGPKDVREIMLKNNYGVNVVGAGINTSNPNTITIQNRGLYYPGQGCLRDQFIERTNIREMKYQQELDKLIEELERRRELERDRELEEMLERYRRFRGYGVEYGIVGGGGGGSINLIGSGGKGNDLKSSDINIEFNGGNNRNDFDLDELMRLQGFLERKGGGKNNRDLEMIGNLIKQREQLREEQESRNEMVRRGNSQNGFNRYKQDEVRRLQYELEKERRKNQQYRENYYSKEKMRMQNELNNSKNLQSSSRININQEVIDETNGYGSSCCGDGGTMCGGAFDCLGCCGFVKAPSPIVAIRISHFFSEHEFLAMSFGQSLVYDRRSFCSYYLGLLNLKQPLFFLINSNRYKEMSSFYVSYRSVTIIVFLIEILIYYFWNLVLFGSRNITRILNGGLNYKRRLIQGAMLFPVCLFTVSLMQFGVYFFPNVKLAQIKILYFNSIIFNDNFKGRPKNFNGFFNSEDDIKGYEDLTIAPQILGVKQDKKKIKGMVESLEGYIFISSLVAFFVLLGILFLMWYLVAGVGALYLNSQGHWFINVLITFTYSNVFEFLYCLIIAAFRHCGTIKGNNCGCWGIARVLTII